MERNGISGLPQDIHSLLHTLWSKAVGTDGYDKSEWKRFNELLVQHTTKPPLASPLGGPKT